MNNLPYELILNIIDYLDADKDKFNLIMSNKEIYIIICQSKVKIPLNDYYNAKIIGKKDNKLFYFKNVFVSCKTNYNLIVKNPLFNMITSLFFGQSFKNIINVLPNKLINLRVYESYPYAFKNLPNSLKSLCLTFQYSSGFCKKPINFKSRIFKVINNDLCLLKHSDNINCIKITYEDIELIHAIDTYNALLYDKYDLKYYYNFFSQLREDYEQFYSGHDLNHDTVITQEYYDIRDLITDFYIDINNTNLLIRQFINKHHPHNNPNHVFNKLLPNRRKHAQIIEDD